MCGEQAGNEGEDEGVEHKPPETGDAIQVPESQLQAHRSGKAAKRRHVGATGNAPDDERHQHDEQDVQQDKVRHVGSPRTEQIPHGESVDRPTREEPSLLIHPGVVELPGARDLFRQRIRRPIPVHGVVGHVGQHCNGQGHERDDDSEERSTNSAQGDSEQHCPHLIGRHQVAILLRP